MGKEQHTVLVVDAGGRGSALVDKYSQSPHVGRIIAIPGNDFMHVSSKKPVETHTNLKTTSLKEIIEISKKEGVSLVDVAQDNAVQAGLVDALLDEGIPVMGPTKAAGEIEWNKAFSREFMSRHNIPQPKFATFDSIQEGVLYLQRESDRPWFVKASGLAEGKGALPAENNSEAIKSIHELQKFGNASHTYLLEEWVRGEGGQQAEEFSSFAVSDGEHFKIIGHAQDHKRVFDGDRGENTGGMGCVSHPLVIDEDISTQVEDIFAKTIKGLRDEGRSYKGILYFGGILVPEEGGQKVYAIEFNARWGDPEAQVLVPGIQSDLFELSNAVINGSLDTFLLQSDNKTRVTVAVTAKGYPLDYSQVKGKEILRLEEAGKFPDIKIYGGGIKKVDDTYVVSGGRVFYVVGEGKDVLQAREKAYAAIERLHIERDNMHYRKDIGWRDAKRTRG